MNSLTDPQDEAIRSSPPDREITLGTTLLLGIFFAIAALCAAFFGFGYSLGTKHNAAINIASESQPGLRPGGTKPTAGSAAPVPKQVPAEISAPSRSGNAPSKPAPETAAPEPLPADTPSARTRPPVEPPPAPLPAGATQFLVQIAAVTHQEDADLIASTLTRRGYAVNIRPELQDKLLHVQVGPFATKKDAEAMRQRLMADGFNAYIK